MDIKKNISLIAAIAVPILMIVVIALCIYLPALFIHPQYDFIYTDADVYSSAHIYQIVNGALVKKENSCGKDDAKSCDFRNDEGRIYYYDVLKNESREISFEEANKLKIDPSIKSPDGFEVVSGSGGEGPFFSGDYNAKFLKKGAYSRKVEYLSQNGYSFDLLGWIKK